MQNWMALEFASKAWQNDKKVALAALRHDGSNALR